MAVQGAKCRTGAANGNAMCGRQASAARNERVAAAPRRPAAAGAKSPPRVVIVNAQQLLAVIVTLLALYWATCVGRVRKVPVEKPPDTTWWDALAALPATLMRLMSDGALRGTVTLRGADVLWLSVLLGLVVAVDAALAAFKQYRRARAERAGVEQAQPMSGACARVDHEQRAATEADDACAPASSRHLASTACGDTASRLFATPRESSCKTTQASASIRTARRAPSASKPSYCLCAGCVQSVRSNELAKARSQLSSLVTAISDDVVPDALVDSGVRRELRNWRLWRVLLGDAPYSALSERDAELFAQSVRAGGDGALCDRCLRCDKPLDAARLRAVDTRSNVRY